MRTVLQSAGLFVILVVIYGIYLQGIVEGIVDGPREVQRAGRPRDWKGFTTHGPRTEEISPGARRKLGPGTQNLQDTMKQENLRQLFSIRRVLAAVNAVVYERDSVSVLSW